MPGFVDPCLAMLTDRAPSGARWIHEIKYDGYRVQAHRDGDAISLYTRRGHDWTDQFGALRAAIERLPVNKAIFDGEVIYPDADGKPDFALLQNELAKGRGRGLLYYIFDILYLDGFDIRNAPLIERKQVLSELLKESGPGPLLFSEHLETDGAAMFANACAMGLEGIVSKKRNGRYVSGRSESWIKVKCQKRGHYPIIAFVEKLGARPRRIASFYIGRWEKGKLLYAGKAQTGFSETQMRELREILDPYVRQTSPLDHPIKKPKATWVDPVIEAEIQYSSITSDGVLREPVYRAVRHDLFPPAAKAATTASKGRRPKSYSGVPPENILQLLPDAVAPSKEELAVYWKRVGKRALLHLGRRPLKLVRHSHHTIFYHRGALPPVPASVHRLTIRKRYGGEGTRVWVDSIEGLLGLIEMDAVELHPWNATVDDLEHPDRIVLDLDPGEGVEWDFVTDTALQLRDILKEEGLKSWPKLTGGKGIHLMAPIEPTLTHDEARAYAKGLAQRLAAKNPARFLITADPAARRGKIFIDYLRNGRGNTAIGTFSPRVREGFPIAAAGSWKQIEYGISADAFTIENSLDW
jgi:bifunctional non-homologous end joining protein LigD